MRLVMVVLWCRCSWLMERALWKCLGKALMKAVRERSDSKCPGKMWDEVVADTVEFI